MMFQQWWKYTLNVIKLAFAFATVYMEGFFWCNLRWQLFGDFDEAIHLLNEVINIKYIGKTTEVKQKSYKPTKL